MASKTLLPKCNISKVRLAHCDHCGIACQFVWPRQRYCADCSEQSRLEKLPHQIARRNERMRLRMRRVRQERGDTEYHAEIACLDCRKVIRRAGPSQIRCEDCQANHTREYKKKHDLNKRIKRGNRLVGSIQKCRHCHGEFIKEGVNQAFCDAQCKAEFWRTNPQWTINRRMSAGINGSLRAGAKAGRRWESLVGYTLADLMAHLEKQFPPRMSWGNRDRWDIDHIVPLAAHNFETTDDPEFAAAWALTNLRPLWKIDNIKKSARRTHLL